MDTAEPVPRYYVNKWVTFSACALIQLSAGLPYAFGLFSPALKRTNAWSQAELTGFGTALNLGSYAAFIPGIMLDLLKNHNSGPRCAAAPTASLECSATGRAITPQHGTACRVCLMLAAAECVGGMGLIWGAFTGHINLSYLSLLAAAFLFANSNAVFDTVSVATNVTNWPNDRGSAVGVMKAAVGLSSSVYGVVFAAYHMSAAAFMLLMMLAPALIALLLLPLVNIVPRMQRSELMPHGLLTTPARFVMAYQVRRAGQLTSVQNVPARKVHSASLQPPKRAGARHHCRVHNARGLNVTWPPHPHAGSGHHCRIHDTRGLHATRQR